MNDMNDEQLFEQFTQTDEADLGAWLATLSAAQRAAIRAQAEGMIGGMQALDERWQKVKAMRGGGEDDGRALADQLIAWVQTPDWDTSEAYLREHAESLLTDEAEAVMSMLIQANDGNETLKQHLALLQACRKDGIEAAYQAHNLEQTDDESGE